MNEETEKVKEMMKQVFDYALANKVNVKITPFTGVPPRNPVVLTMNNLRFEEIGIVNDEVRMEDLPAESQARLKKLHLTDAGDIREEQQRLRSTSATTN